MKSSKLSTDSQRLFTRVVKQWGIKDGAGLFLLETALQARDEMVSAQETLASEGIYIEDRFKQQRLHPAAQREKESRAHMLAAFKQLNLDLESIK